MFTSKEPINGGLKLSRNPGQFKLFDESLNKPVLHRLWRFIHTSSQKRFCVPAASRSFALNLPLEGNPYAFCNIIVRWVFLHPRRITQLRCRGKPLPLDI
ncbi:protein of unknown function [Acidithiobacillus ferrivorans]|uniref:Uncharacterized protein n=1 Tax=Acidithiobacillus ferrivorans TaxID=160808 RepID=A0A060UQ37_9PROT|nr:hypothetical protein AFERRI_120021 [Acidithiobacillus ferrivorans]SMH66640.1 protein of unknown function [Acidithiobacillus ferrivorans]